MSPGERIIDMMHELDKMRGCALLRELNRLDLSEFILETNYTDPKKVIEGIATDPRVDELLDVRQRDQIEVLIMHITRLIHNFAAAVMSLREHTYLVYRVWNQAKDGRPFSDFQARIDADFARDPLAQFIVRFRNYCQHCGPPPVEFSLHLENGSARKSISLSSEELLRWNDWTAPARQYLVASPEHIDILAAATAYRAKVLIYTQWFNTREREIFADEIRQFMDKQRKFFLLRIDSSIDGEMASRVPVSIPKETLFASILNSQHFAQLEQTPPDSIERAQLAIALLERDFFTIPDEFKRKVEAYFTAERSPQYDGQE